MANPINIVINATNNAKKTLQDANKDLDSFKASVKSAGIALVAFFGIDLAGGFLKGLGETADRWKTLNAFIKTSSDSTQEFSQSQQAVIDISKKTFTSLEENARLFSKVNTAVKGLGGDSQQAMSATEQVAKLVALSGTNAESAAAGVFQFTQALGSNQLRGAELNSVLEQTPALAKAIAEGLGKNIAQLRKAAEAGELDTATILQALENQKAKTDKAFADLPITLSKALQLMSNQWLEFVGRLDESSGVSATVAEGIKLIANNIDTLGKFALNFIAVGLVAGLAKLATTLISVGQASRLASLEAKANAVANAQAAKAEEERVAALMAAVAAQEANIQADIAATRVTIAETQAQIRYTQSMIAGAATMQARAVLVNRINTLNAELSASTALLAEQQQALNVVQTEGNLTASRLASATTLLSVGFAALISYEVGSWFREQSVYVEKFGVILAAQADLVLNFFNVLANPVDWASSWIDQFNAIGDKSIAELKQEEETNAKAVESKKQAEAEKVRLAQEGFAKLQGKADAVVELYKQGYERDVRNLEQAESAKLAAIEQSKLSERDKLNQSVATEIDYNAKRLQATVGFNLQKLQLVTQLYDQEIAIQKSRNLSTEQLERDGNNAKKTILLEIEKSYETSIARLTALDKQHRDKAVGYLKEIEDSKRGQLERERQLDLIGLSDYDASEKRKKQLAQDTATLKKLIADGEYAKAVELGKKIQDLTFENAQAAKQAAAEQNKIRSGSGNDFAAKQARDQYTESVKLTEQALQKAAQAETLQADTAKANADKQQEALNQTRQQVEAIDLAIQNANQLNIKVDTTEIDAAKRAIEAIPSEKVVTIKTVGDSSPSSTRGYATGGLVQGAGTETSDSILARLSKNEFIVKAKSVASVGANTLHYINRHGKLPAFKDGGSVNFATPLNPALFNNSQSIASSSSNGPEMTLNLDFGKYVVKTTTQQTDTVKQLHDYLIRESRARK